MKSSLYSYKRFHIRLFNIQRIPTVLFKEIDIVRFEQKHHTLQNHIDKSEISLIATPITLRAF
jgi:hypothetical protein